MATRRLLATQDEASRIAEMRAGERITLLRDIKPKPDHFYRDIIGKPKPWKTEDWNRLIPQHGPNPIPCPYPVGTEVWVAETFVIETSFNVGDYPPPFSDGRPVRYYKDCDFGKWWDQPHYRATDPEPDLAYEDLDGPACRWTPSCRMPQWASRSCLVVREVGVDGARWKYEMEKVR